MSSEEDTQNGNGLLSVAPCRFFLRSSCRFGDRCRFFHSTQSRAPVRTPINFASESTSSTSTSDTTNNIIDPDKWIQAPVFIPKSSQPSFSFANIVDQNYMNNYAPSKKPDDNHQMLTRDELCPFLVTGICYNESCPYTHGNLCELCQRFCLHPTDVEQRRKHEIECVAEHEKDMEHSFAIAKSKDKSCGICFETIMEKPGSESRFGILPNCQHCFCLECIRKWRQAELFDNNIKRACPECRITSDFVCPSLFWVDTKEEKEKLIKEYKNAMVAKDCKYYNKGSGKCPFGNKCFYRHANPDGTLVDVGVPPRPARRLNHLGELEDLEDILFWDLLRIGRLQISDAISLTESDAEDW